MLMINFDKDFSGISQSEVITGIPIEAPVLVQGKLGQALKSGPTTGYVEYPTKGIIMPKHGTVEMWVCPLDWNPNDKEFHVFFEASGEGALYLYKYWESASLLMLTRDDNTNDRNRYSVIDISNWKPGEWHHIAGTWSAEGVMCYVDGKPAGKNPTEGWLPKTLGANFQIGDLPWQLPRTSASLIDEVRIYDRALSPAHIAAHKDGNYDFFISLTKDGSSLKYEFYPDLEEVQVCLSTGGADVEDSRISARLAIVLKDGAIPLDATIFPFIDGLIIRSLSFTSPPPGEYDIVAEVLLDGSPAFELRSALVIPTMEWKGNKFGKEDKVLPPWTPLKISKRRRDCRIQCWGREYSFNRSALPTQIISQNKKLLSHPVSLQMSCRGHSASWTEQSIEFLAHSDTRAELAGSMVGSLGGQSIRFKTHITTEYDGLLLIKLSCETPEKLEHIDSMHIEIPWRGDLALYLHRYVPDRWQGYSGLLPDRGRFPECVDLVDQTKFIPYAWMGDNDCGLFWFCESDEYWPNSENEEAIQIYRSSGDVRLRLNLVKGQTLHTNWEFAFGLQATPIKFQPMNWRKWRLEPAKKNANISVIWPAPDRDSLKYFGYPEAMDTDCFDKRVKGLHADGKKVVPYLCLVGLSSACPEWPYFRKWAIGPDFITSSDVAAYGASFRVISPAPDYADFTIWKNKQFIDRYGIDGVYHDLTEPWGSTTGGCGYVRDGKVRPTYPILAFRDLYRRLYSVIKSTHSAPSETFTIAHESGKIIIPILAYDDSHLDGEHFYGRVKDSYLDVLPMDVFRTEFMGRQWGSIPLFLPEFGENSSQVKPTRGMMAYLMIHDVNPWAVWCNAEVVDQARAALDEFCYFDANFIPYFDPQPPATFEPKRLPITDVIDPKNVYISAYQHANKRTLLIIANLDKVARIGRLKINFQRLGLDRLRLPLTITNWLDKRPLALNDDRALNIDIKGLDYKMIVIEAK